MLPRRSSCEGVLISCFILGIVSSSAFLLPRTSLQPSSRPTHVLYSRAEVASRPVFNSRRGPPPFSIGTVPKAGDSPERPSVRMSKKSRQERAQQLQSQLKEIEEAGRDATPGMYEAAIRACAKLGDCSTAIKLLRALEEQVGREDKGKKPSRLAYNLVLEAAANGNKQDQAMKIYREMLRDEERVGVNVFTYGPLLTLCAKRGDGANALKLLEEMERRGVQASALTYTAAIDACERGGLREETMRLLREMKDKGVKPTVVTYNTIIARRAEHADTWTDALEWLERLLLSGLEPDRSSFASAINACERAQDWGLVVELTEKAGMLADVTMLTRQINALIKLEKFQQAIAVMEQVKERELQPDEVLYTLVIKACALNGNMKEAMAYMDEMRKAGLAPNVVTFSAAMEACKPAGAWEAALDLLSEMKAQGVQANEVTYSILMDVLAAGGQWQRALHLFMTLDRQAGVKKNVWLYTAAIRACAKGQQLETALGMLREVTSSPSLGPTNDYESLCLYTAALDACEKGGNGVAALALLKEMKVERGVDPDEVAYGAAISACRKGGQVPDTLRLLSYMVNQKMNPNLGVYNTVLGALCSTPQYLGKAVEILRFMIQTSGKGTVPKPNAQSFTQVVDALADDLRWKEAIEVYEIMRKEGHRPEVLTCAKVIRACEKNQCWREALQLLDNMRKDEYQIYELQLLDQIFKKILQVVAAGFGKAAPPSSSPLSEGEEVGGEGQEDRLERTLNADDNVMSSASPLVGETAGRPTERVREATPTRK